MSKRNYLEKQTADLTRISNGVNRQNSGVRNVIMCNICVTSRTQNRY
jgi:hypothetical protein